LTALATRIALALVMAAAAGCAPVPPPPRSAGTSPDSWPARIDGAGTEPFWALAIDRQAVRYSSPDEPAGRSGTVVRVGAHGRLVLSGTLAGESLRAELTRETCSDGMSDRVWPFRLAVTLGARTLSGCAAPRA